MLGLVNLKLLARASGASDDYEAGCLADSIIVPVWRIEFSSTVVPSVLCST